MSLEFWEFDGYPQENSDRKQFTATRKLRVAWSSREQLRVALIAWPGAVYPYLSNWSIRCNAVSIVPLGAVGQDNTFENMTDYGWAVVTARYQSPVFGEPQPHPDPSKANDPSNAISESIEPNVEAMRLDAGLFEWSDGTALQDDEAPVKIVHRMGYALTRHYQNGPPAEAVTYVGKINDAAVNPLLMTDITYPKHTLMYVPPAIGLATNPDGEDKVDITHRFAFKEEGWRKFWRADTQAYDTMKLKEGGAAYDMPEEADFSVLFP